MVVEQVDELVGATQVVRSAPWDDVPSGPFLIELFVHPQHRRQGLARALLVRSIAPLRAAEAATVALRVDSTNTPAVELYRSIGLQIATS